MICPKCHREMGDKLTCDFCGFAFRVPKKKTEPAAPVEEAPEIPAVEAPKPIDPVSLIPDIMNLDAEESSPEAEESFEEAFSAAKKASEEDFPMPNGNEGFLPSQLSKITRVKPAVIEDEPDEDPISIGKFIGMILISIIPIVGIVFCIIWACKSTEKPTRSRFAVAVLIVKAIFIVFALGSVIAYLMLNAPWMLFWIN